MSTKHAKKVTVAFEELLQNNHISFEKNELENKKAFFNEWKSVFYRNSNRETNKIFKHQYWLIFGFNYTAHQTEQAAIDAYTMLKAKSYYLAPSTDNIPTYTCNGSLISYLELYAFKNAYRYIGDIYITATDYSWTFVLTSTGWSGPFFSRA